MSLNNKIQLQLQVSAFCVSFKESNIMLWTQKNIIIHKSWTKTEIDLFIFVSLRQIGTLFLLACIMYLTWPVSCILGLINDMFDVAPYLTRVSVSLHGHGVIPSDTLCLVCPTL